MCLRPACARRSRRAGGLAAQYLVLPSAKDVLKRIDAEFGHDLREAPFRTGYRPGAIEL